MHFCAALRQACWMQRCVACCVVLRAGLCRVWCCVVLCCVVLCCLCCALPRCAVMCCALLCYAGLDWFSLCWAVLCCAVQLLWSALLCFILCDDMTAYRKIELQKTSDGQPKPGGANVLRSLALASFFVDVPRDPFLVCKCEGLRNVQSERANGNST